MTQFANVEHKVNRAIGIGEWEALYVRGQNTYLEIFEQFSGRNIGDFGFGFGFDEPNQIDSFYLDIQTTYPTVNQGNFIRPEDPYPLFKYIELPDIKSSFSTQMIDPFIIQYTDDTFKLQKTKGDFPLNDVSRRRYNSASWNPNAYLADVTGIHLKLERDVLNSFAALLGDLNFIEDNRGTFGISFEEKSVAHPLNCRISMSLTKPVEQKKEIQLTADARLIMNDATAVLVFGNG